MGGFMGYKAGFVYHVKDEYFDTANDPKLMRNHENGKMRPTCYCLKDENSGIMWMVPMASDIEKYQREIDKDIKRYGKCNKILIAEYGGGKSVFLIQNCFPILPKYIDHIHTISGNAVSLAPHLQKKLASMFGDARAMHGRNIKNVIFPDIKRLERIMLDELYADKLLPETATDFNNDNDAEDDLER
jgi:hypothetical protein